MAFSDLFGSFVRDMGREFAGKVVEAADLASEYVEDATRDLDGSPEDLIGRATGKAKEKEDRARAMSILGVSTTDKEAVAAAYKEKVKTAHPDKGGSAEAFQRLTWARELLTR